MASAPHVAHDAYTQLFAQFIHWWRRHALVESRTRQRMRATSQHNGNAYEMKGLAVIRLTGRNNNILQRLLQAAHSVGEASTPNTSQRLA